jgi:methionyl-tRNA formyltransferase
VPLAGEISAGIGQVVALQREDVLLGVGTGEGVLGLLKLQLAGKRVTTAAEFLRGQRDFIGAVLPS